MIGLIWGLSAKSFILYAIAIIASIAVFAVVARRLGWNPPDWVKEIFWIVVVAFVGIVAVIVIWSLIQGA